MEIVLKVSYLEIYNEDKEETLAIKEDIDGGIRVAGLSEVTMTSAGDMFRCLENGSVGRTTGSTAMNLQSSRSHGYLHHLCTAQKGRFKRVLLSCQIPFGGSCRFRESETHSSTEDRFREGVNINRGLLAFGNVISALGDENGCKSHIPYRDSKLTRLLQDSLGGNVKKCFITCLVAGIIIFSGPVGHFVPRQSQITSSPGRGHTMRFEGFHPPIPCVLSFLYLRHK